MINIKEELLKESQNQCYYCKTKLTFTSSVIEHIIPISKGGSNNKDNLVVSCIPCSLIQADKIIDMIKTPYIIEPIVKLLIHAYLKRPILTLVFSIFSLLLIIYAIYIGETKINKISIQNQSFNLQLKNLNETENNLNQLLKFINMQKTQMQLQESAIQKLKLEKENLEPILLADRKAIDALFRKQEERSLENAKIEKYWGIFYGIVASILAAIIIYITKFFFLYYTKKEL